MQSVEQIAKSLTKAQREALCCHDPYFGDREHGWPGAARDVLSFAQAGRRMMDMKLICWTPDKRSSRTMITALGQKVRLHILGAPHAH